MRPAEGRGVSARLSCNHHQSHYSLLDPSWCVRALLRLHAVRGSSFGAFMGMGPVSQHISLNGTGRTPDYSSNPVWREADFHFVEKKIKCSIKGFLVRLFLQVLLLVLHTIHFRSVLCLAVELEDGLWIWYLLGCALVCHQR